ncbi:acyl carrier protein [Helicobacter didelphidarum]|uniref:Acyl carrier protein n=1 Tax=Helicobacter didelphidarum TaxID=2040648 RepID=A0A3D8IMS4_9HELI|nr:acyl carrier protein [Helicobacter didelphidarum]RDU66512.1 acyl carrier protein [Helicobacter didelphidarum]
MTKQAFLESLKDALQRDEDLSEDMALEDIEEWDSLSIISLISLYDSLFGITLSGNTLKNCKGVSDLIKLANGKIEG